MRDDRGRRCASLWCGRLRIGRPVSLRSSRISNYARNISGARALPEHAGTSEIVPFIPRNFDILSLIGTYGNSDQNTLGRRSFGTCETPKLLSWGSASARCLLCGSPCLGGETDATSGDPMPTHYPILRRHCPS